MNSFKNLPGGEETQAPPTLRNRVKQKVNGEVGLLRFVANVFDLYVPKVISVFVAASSGRENKAIDPASKVDNGELNAPPPHNQHLGPNLSGVSDDRNEE